jgi:hypothetical protein
VQGLPGSWSSAFSPLLTQFSEHWSLVKGSVTPVGTAATVGCTGILNITASFIRPMTPILNLDGDKRVDHFLFSAGSGTMCYKTLTFLDCSVLSTHGIFSLEATIIIALL